MQSVKDDQKKENEQEPLVEALEAEEIEGTGSPVAQAEDSSETDLSTNKLAVFSASCNDDNGSGGELMTSEPDPSSSSAVLVEEADSNSRPVVLAENSSATANVAAEVRFSPQPTPDSDCQQGSPVPMRAERPQTAPVGGRRQRRKKDLSLVPIKTGRGRSKSRSRPSSATSSPATSPHSSRPLSPHFGTAKRSAYLKLSSSTAQPVPSTYETMADGRAPCPTKYSKLSNRDIEDPATPAGPITAGRHQVFGHSIHAQRDLS